MAVKIRLTRFGDKKNPHYRIVVADSRSPRDGKFLEILGHYNPLVEKPEIIVDKELVTSWIAKGATPTDTARAVLVQAGALASEKYKPKPNAKPAKPKEKKKKGS